MQHPKCIGPVFGTIQHVRFSGDSCARGGAMSRRVHDVRGTLKNIVIHAIPAYTTPCRYMCTLSLVIEVLLGLHTPFRME